MKTTLFAAAAALSLFACASPTAESAASSESNDTVVTTITTSTTDLDIVLETLDVQCTTGAMRFQFQNKEFVARVSSFAQRCEEQLELFQSVGVRHVNLVKERRPDIVRWTLDFGDRFVFDATSDGANDTGLVLSTTVNVDLALGSDLAEVGCRTFKSIYAFLSVKLRGEEYLSYAGETPSSCTEKSDRFNASSRHGGTLTTTVTEELVTKRLDLDNGAWTLEFQKSAQ